MSEKHTIKGADEAKRLFDAALKQGASQRARAYTRRVIVCAGGGRLEVPPHVSDDLAAFALSRLATQNGQAYLEVDGVPEVSGQGEAAPAPTSRVRVADDAGSGQVLALLRARRHGVM